MEQDKRVTGSKAGQGSTNNRELGAVMCTPMLRDSFLVALHLNGVCLPYSSTRMQHTLLALPAQTPGSSPSFSSLNDWGPQSSAPTAPP